MPRVVPSQVVALIDQTFPQARSEPKLNVHSEHAAILSAIVKLSAQIPPELIHLSGENYTDLVLGLAALENVVTKWHLRGGNEPMNQIRKTSPISVVRAMLALCPDAMPSTATSGLAFIADAKLRDSIRLDLSAATNALHNGEWKASTVMSGAVVEALLLWKIQEDPTKLSTLANKPLGDPEKWILADLIRVAGDLNFIKRETIEMAGHARDYRNLIHPGKAQRKNLVCDRATALTALAAAETAIRDLS